MKTLQNGSKISDQAALATCMNIHLHIMHVYYIVSKGLTRIMVVLNRVSFFEFNNT